MYQFREIVDSLCEKDSLQLEEQFGTHNYHPLPVDLVRAEGHLAYDRDGREYIDCIGAYSAVAQGHLSPGIVETAIEQLHVMGLVSRAVHTPELGVFLREVCEFTGMDMACPMNSGAEAVETAIKLARKWGYTRKGIPTDQAEIIVADGNFHGRTITVIGFSSEPKYKSGFGPFSPGFKLVPFGDLDAIRNAIGPNTCAVLMEPILAEGGILIPPDGFMSGLRKLCTDQNMLLVWDEVQTGFGRTGKNFAWQHEDAEPDLMCLGKALGGGIYPVSAVVGKRKAMEVFQPGDHGSTFGGNPVAAAIGFASIRDLKARGLTENSERMGKRLLEKVRRIDSPALLEVRGRGLLVGIEVRPEANDVAIGEAFLREGILTKETRHRTFRLAPPLTVGEDVVDEIVRRVERVLATP